MPTVEAAFKEIRRHAKRWGVHPRPPCSPAAMKELVNGARAEFAFEVPDDYVRLLRLTDGLQTQSGYIHGAEAFLEYNSDHWCRDITTSQKGDVLTVRFDAKAPSDRIPPAFALIGDEGNMEWFVYMLQPPEYRVTTMGFADEVHERFQGLGELLLRLAKTR